jgi:hypothetical protein
MASGYLKICARTVCDRSSTLVVHEDWLPTKLLPAPLDGGDADLVSGFQQDMLTDWVPDPIGASDVLSAWAETPDPLEIARLSDSPSGSQMEAAFRGRVETVRIIDSPLRAALHIAVETSIRESALRLLPTVCGYRDAGTPYRVEYLRWRDSARHLSTRPRTEFVVVADIANFFSDVSLSSIRQRVPLNHVANQLLGGIATNGPPLLPGHHWACRLANALLQEFDTEVLDSLGVPWLRWMDDIHIYVSSEAIGRRVLDRVGQQLRNRGLRLNHAKARIMAANEYRARHLATPTEQGQTLQQILDWALAADDMRGLRYVVRRMGLLGDPSFLKHCSNVIRRHAELAPRIAMYLDLLAQHVESDLAVVQMASDDSEFVAARGLAICVRRVRLVERLPASIVLSRCASQVGAVAGLAWRVARLSGFEVDPPSERLRRWSQQTGNLRANLPILETNL